MPPKYDVRLLPAAEADFGEVIAYIALDNPSAAGSLAEMIEKNLANLHYHLMGKTPDEEHLARMGYRYLVAGNYLIFYAIEQRIVWIHRIIHGARDYLPLFQ